jgi:hypothetical protein
MAHDLHCDMPTDPIKGHSPERYCRIWWTVYILEQNFTLSMDDPISIQNRDITTPLPLLSPTSQKAASLAIHVKLPQLVAEIVDSKLPIPPPGHPSWY